MKHNIGIGSSYSIIFQKNLQIAYFTTVIKAQNPEFAMNGEIFTANLRYKTRKGFKI